jgi:dTDP-4-amino-4,6-dideoxygalactose transaminase
MTRCDFEVPIVEPNPGTIPLFMPHIPAKASQYVAETLSSRWIGQGPKVDRFESAFSARFADHRTSISVGSGTDALHLSYILAGIGPGDEVLTPLFTCTATNIPLLYLGARPIFVDVEPNTLNFDVADARRRVTEKTKAIVVVHYGGLPCNMREIQALADEIGVPVIEDAAHALGAKYENKWIGSISDYTMFSFQAIKHLTTGDGGMVTLADPTASDMAKRYRWFGIDRSKKQGGIWENDISEVGYKYQMTDIAAAMGLAGLEEFDWVLEHRQTLLRNYLDLLSDSPEIKVLSAPVPNSVHAAWLLTVAVRDRPQLQRKLLSAGIESNQVHYRNDRYSIFGGRRDDFPNMDSLEADYLVLPLHTKMNTEDVFRIVEVIKSGW